MKTAAFPRVSAKWLGRIDYVDAEARQKAAADRVREAHRPCLEILGLEHEPVITLGIRGRAEDDLHFGSDVLAAQGWELVRTDRGGQATLHAPGQLVIYPICPLASLGLGVREFVDLLLTTSQLAFLRYSLKTEKRLQPAGLWCEDSKILFCGLRIDRGVSRHGISLNISNDPADFQRIRPCGQRAEKITSMGRETSSIPSPSEFFEVWCEDFNAQLYSLLQDRVRETSVPSSDVVSWRSW